MSQENCIYRKGNDCIEKHIIEFNTKNDLRANTRHCGKNCKLYSEDPFVGCYLNGD